MPKPIKKKAGKRKKKDEADELQDLMSRLRGLWGKYQKEITYGAGALVLAALIAAGMTLYSGSTREKAEAYFLDGDKQYYGLYDAEAVPEAQRMQKALESFQKSYEAMKAPNSLYYVADCNYSMGRYDDAKEALVKMLEEFPDDQSFSALGWYKLAFVQMKTNKLEDALVSLNRLYSSPVPQYKDMALVESARLLDLLGRPEEAAEKYEELKDGYPESVFSQEAEIWLARAKGDEEGGEEVPAETPGGKK